MQHSSSSNVASNATVYEKQSHTNTHECLEENERITLRIERALELKSRTAQRKRGEKNSVPKNPIYRGRRVREERVREQSFSFCLSSL